MPSTYAKKQPKILRKKPTDFFYTKGFKPKKTLEQCTNCGRTRLFYLTWTSKCSCGGVYQTFGIQSHFRKE